MSAKQNVSFLNAHGIPMLCNLKRLCAWWPRHPRLSGGTVSLALHVGLAIVAGAWSLVALAPARALTGLDSGWSQPVDVDLLLQVDLQAAAESVQELEPSGAEWTGELATVSDASAAEPAVHDEAGGLDLDTVLDPLDRVSTQLSSTVAARRSQHPAGDGNGAGADSGPAGGRLFFGVPIHSAEHVVFVVDNSRSMNYPHDSPAKTRFRRLKQELLSCILQMQPHQSFYVIFFANKPTMMPSRTLQPAVPGIREPFLRWIAEVSVDNGPTDPRDSLRRALAMQPDIIYFLTDGDFPDKVVRSLSKIEQSRTAIYTFAIGDDSGAETLEAVARQNRGVYRFVP